MPPKNPSSESMTSDLLVIGTELRMTRELIERSDTEADRRLSLLEEQFKEFDKRLKVLEEERAAGRAVEKDRAAAGEWWGRVASWVGVGITILFGLGSAAWALFVRGEK